MAKRRSYKKDEKLLTKILIGEAAVFLVYLISAASGWTFLKTVASIAIIVVSVLGLAFLYLTGELKRIRSRWMVTGFGAVLLCLLVSLLVKYPAPKPVTADTSAPAGTSTSNSAPASTDGTEAPTGTDAVG